MLRQSQFTVVRDLDAQGLPDHYLIFNTQTSRCICVGKAEWSMIGEACAAGRKDPALSRLQGLGMLVDDATDEVSDFLEQFDRVRYHPRRIYPIFAITSACNIGCTYCYEAGVVGKTMRPEVISGIARWVERRIQIDGIREIYPSLFGGEPLLFPQLLFSLMDQINEAVRRLGANCAFAASSNGLFLTDDLAKELSVRGLTQIQISLDGPKDIHDARRVGKRGEGTFEKSLAGIKIALNHLENVTLKVNFDRHNASSLPALFAFLEEEGLSGKVDVKLETIAKQFPGSKVMHAEAHIMPPNSLELSSAYIDLALSAEHHGFKVRRDTAHTTPCMFSSHHGVLVGPSGNIYKCISLVGRPEYRVGTIWDDAYDELEYASQMNVVKRMDECIDEKCPYMPVCAGGCSYESITRRASYLGRFCKKDYLAEFHFKRNLAKHDAALRKLGMPAIHHTEANQLHAAPGGCSDCGGGCQSAAH
jgi:uncharacterized protein